MAREPALTPPPPRAQLPGRAVARVRSVISDHPATPTSIRGSGRRRNSLADHTLAHGRISARQRRAQRATIPQRTHLGGRERRPQEVREPPHLCVKVGVQLLVEHEARPWALGLTPQPGDELQLLAVPAPSHKIDYRYRHRRTQANLSQPRLFPITILQYLCHRGGTS
jgi:hypothetical protein